MPLLGRDWSGAAWDGTAHIFVVDLAIRLGFPSKESGGATAVKFDPAFANECLSELWLFT